MKPSLINTPSRRAERRRRQGGFTLTELMVTVLIIGLLSTAAVIYVVPQIARGQSARVISDLRTIEQALDFYRIDMGGLPTEQEGLQALVDAPTGHRRFEAWDGPYLRRGMPEDPWGQPYQYYRPGRAGEPYEIVSFGADGVAGGDDENADFSTSTAATG